MNAQHQYSLTGSVAEMYEQNMVPAIFARFAKGLLEFAQLHVGEHVLDVACGTGIVARLAWPQVAPSGRVLGLDVNATMLDVARRAIEELKACSRRKGASEVLAQIAIGLVKTYGVSLAEVARRLGVSTSAISKIIKRSNQ